MSQPNNPYDPPGPRARPPRPIISAPFPCGQVQTQQISDARWANLENRALSLLNQIVLNHGALIRHQLYFADQIQAALAEYNEVGNQLGLTLRNPFNYSGVIIDPTEMRLTDYRGK